MSIFPSALPMDPSLTERESVIDVLHRAILAFDSADQTLLESALTIDCTLDLDGFVLHGIDDIIAKCYSPISKLDTTHFASNLRTNFRNNNKAQLTCSTLAQHFPECKGKEPHSQNFLGGTMYWLDLVKGNDSIWRISHWKLHVVWSQGEKSVLGYS